VDTVTATPQSPASEPPATAAATRDKTRVPLDRVMLAMDVVDTLRHQRQLVEAELDEDARRREFTQRVQQIYQAQGLEVDADIIAEAVEALREDRFVYEPPARSFAVRLAEVYVERGKWALRIGLLALLALILWAGFAIPAHFHRQGQIDDFRDRVAATMQRAGQLAEQARELRARSDSARPDVDSAAIEDQLATVRALLESGGKDAELVRAALTPSPDPDTYPDAPSEWDRTIHIQQRTLNEADQELLEARQLLENIDQLRTLGRRLEATVERLRGLELSATERTSTDDLQLGVRSAMAEGDGPAAEEQLTRLQERIERIRQARQQQAEIRASFEQLGGALAGVAVEPAARAELEDRRHSVEQAIAAGNWAQARTQLGELKSLIRLLDREYELRITTRGRSGVWRHPNGNRRARNYYIIVEAIDRAGKPVPLRIKSEEYGHTRSVRKFGIRVSKPVYERVKADKLDNGIIDKRLFGVKQRGHKTVEYRFDTAGGMITEW